MSREEFYKYKYGEIDDNSLILPNIIFLGAQKAGSTSISHWLFNGGVCKAKLFPRDEIYFGKEVHYFDYDERYSQGIDFYSQRFEHCIKEQHYTTGLIMDATPDYLTYPERIYETYSQVPNALSTLKVMLVIREPVSRELSLYNHAHAYNNNIASTFEEYTEVLVERLSNPNKAKHHTGLYVDHIKKFNSFLNRDQILILSYHEVKTNPDRAQWRIEQFLGQQFEGELPRYNTHDSAQKEKVVSERAWKLLGPIFYAKNRELFQYLEDNQGPWMEQRPLLSPFPDVY